LQSWSPVWTPHFPGSNLRPPDYESYATRLSYLTDYQSIYKKGTLHGFFPLVEPGS
jgi:hypothetical protein